MSIRTAEQYVQEEKDVGNYNLQAWVSVRKVATILSMLEGERNLPRTASQFVTMVIDTLYAQAKQKGFDCASTVEAIEWMERKGFSTRQMKAGRSGKRTMVAMQVEDLKQKRGKDAISAVMGPMSPAELSRITQDMVKKGQLTPEMVKGFEEREQTRLKQERDALGAMPFVQELNKGDDV
jgi:hypothetical protein